MSRAPACSIQVDIICVLVAAGLIAFNPHALFGIVDSGRPREADHTMLARDAGRDALVADDTADWRGIGDRAAAGGLDHRDSTKARMSRFSKTRPPVSLVSRTATSTMARAKSSAGIT